MLIVFLSVTGQCRRFVNKLNLPSFELNDDNCFTEVFEPFIIIAPTYVKEVTEVINDFIETGNNVSFCKGVCGSGNRNFNKLFCFTARDLCRDYNLENILEFEFQGNQNDVDYLKKWIENHS